MEQLISFIIWAAILQGVLLSCIYFFSKKYNSASNKILGFFLISLLTEAINQFLPIDEIGGYMLYYYFGLPETKLFLPVFFLHYVLFKNGRLEPYRKTIRIGYILAFSVVGITVVNIGIFLITGRQLVDFLTPEKTEVVFMTQQVLAWIFSALALIIAQRETVRAKQTLEDEYSDFAQLNIRWLWQFIWLMAPVVILWGLELLRIALGGMGSLSTFVMINWGILFIVIYFVSYKAFVHKDLFEKGHKPVGEKPDQDQSILENELEEVHSSLEVYMREYQPYLKSDLTLHELASSMGIPSRKISQCINRRSNSNFSTWINTYRVETAIQMLESTESSNLSIEGIGQQSGFKSRSAMYLAFKKLTDKSPGDFKA